jgi:phage repressor protein C with HTH and peptisase S24 domain
MSLKKLVETRLKDLNRSPAEATEKGQLGRTYLYDVLNSSDERTLTSRTLPKLAAALDMTPEDVTRALGEGTLPHPEVEVAEVHTQPFITMRKDVPVMGTAMGSVFQNVEGFEFRDGPIDYARRPPALANIKGVYAIYIVNDSMWPMHPAGDLRFVNPHRPPVVGGSVIVQTKSTFHDPGMAYIKLLKKRTPTKLILEQFNPVATIEIPMEFVQSVHHVYTMNELFGV